MNTLSTLVDTVSVRRWLKEFDQALAIVDTPFQAKRALTAIELATDYVRRLKLGVTVELECVVTSIFTELVLGQTLIAEVKAGRLQAGRPRKILVDNEDFSLKLAGISWDESSHSQRFAQYVEQFGLEALHEIVETGKKSETLSRTNVFKTIDQLLRRKEHERILDNPQFIETLTGPFDLIMADPPWQYEAQVTPSRAIENQYPTATLEEIKTHVPNSSGDSVLFLWATAPKLIEALQVLEAWGFCYRTCAVWDKQILGMGYWFRGQHELLLVATKGDFSPPADFLRVSSIFTEKRIGHSQKPQCVYEWIERTWPNVNKLEMYARTRRSGWAIWGNEIINA